MLTKGAAVLAHTDWRVARRPMDDLDVAVPRALAPRAMEVLRSRGFESPLADDPRHLDERHALPFRDAAGAELDLHWHVLHGSLHPDADAAFWAAAQPAEVRGVACRVLCREDAVLQAMTQGREFSDTHPLRWAADAAELLRGAPAFDWDRVVEQARRHRLTAELRAALEVLAEVTGEPMPAGGRPGGGRRRRAVVARRRTERARSARVSRAATARSPRARSSGCRTSCARGCGARSRPARA